ncbi:MAG: carboxypeptidase regulatory-like domain-containing protein [Planctomycetota bacterium]|jgi:plastocyanin|nr:carboxypeptidase regulatory-like domain-containing protein [Planctomycetota bacterium]MDP6763967.1 carboxypeptidase regulatory-like domain-containing protein [Planctomycetota bacterium]MDP6990125.1 carboxypeptidase regulatory-like domain-containing protein [Planctomycetota bacterium]
MALSNSSPAILILTCCAACGGGAEEGGGAAAQEPERPAAAPTVAVEAPEVSDGAVTDDTPGTVTGMVVFHGEPPEREELSLSGCDHGDEGATLDNRVLVADGRLQNVFVTVKGLRGVDAQPPAEAALLDQQGCIYTPRVLGLQVGQTLRVRNGDPLNHNVHVYARRKTFPNNTQAPGAEDFLFVFDRKEPAPVPIGCDIHPWMKSTVHVTDHPFFSVTDAAGEFAIEGLPPGKHTLTAWHEVYGKLSAELELPPGGAARVEFAFED